MPSGSSGHAASEADRFREELSQAETRGQRRYDERREHQSWPQQVEDDQETWRGTNDDVPGPVPDHPPGLLGPAERPRCEHRCGRSGTGLQGLDYPHIEKKHERIIVKPWPKSQDFDVW